MLIQIWGFPHNMCLLLRGWLIMCGSCLLDELVQPFAFVCQGNQKPFGILSPKRSSAQNTVDGRNPAPMYSFRVFMGFRPSQLVRQCIPGLSMTLKKWVDYRKQWGHGPIFRVRRRLQVSSIIRASKLDPLLPKATGHLKPRLGSLGGGGVRRVESLLL